MAAAAGTALRRSVVATKMGVTAAARAPSLRHHPLLLAGRRSGPASFRHHISSSSAPNGSTSTPANNKDLNQKKNGLSEWSRSKRVAAYLACLTLYGVAAFEFFWVKPKFEELQNEISALRSERSILIKAAEECQRTHIKAQDMLADSSQAQRQAKGFHGQQAS